MVNSKQLTIVFHVDDCKLLHVDSKVIDDTIADWLHEDYKSHVFEDGSDEMKVNWGKVHKYLGMNLEHSITLWPRLSTLPSEQDQTS